MVQPDLQELSLPLALLVPVALAPVPRRQALVRPVLVVHLVPLRPALRAVRLPAPRVRRVPVVLVAALELQWR